MHQESTASFTEVQKPSGRFAQISNRNSADPRIIIRWQDAKIFAKIYVPEKLWTHFPIQSTINSLKTLYRPPQP